MTVDKFNKFCGNLDHTSHVIQWGGAHVWKVAGKVFAIGGWNDGDYLFVKFKTSKLNHELLEEQAGMQLAPYLASRSMKWIQRTRPDTLDDSGLQNYIRETYRIVSLGLSKKKQRKLGLNKFNETANA